MRFWQLYKSVIGKHGPLPTLIEWDSKFRTGARFGVNP